MDLDISPGVTRLSPDTELVLFRVVQEALTNVFRHSKSGTARVRLTRKLTRRKEEIVLTIEDGGKGMSEVSGVRRLISRKGKFYPNYGVGRASMRERLDQIGGRLEVRSGVGGTRVEAVVPTEQAN